MRTPVQLLELSSRNLISSSELANEINSGDYSGCAAIVVGYGNMGRQYVRTLQRLKVGRIRVCSRSSGPLEELKDTGVEGFSNGFERFTSEPASANDLAIIATPTRDLMSATRHMLDLGFRKLLVEKPVALYSRQIKELAVECESRDADVACAYNRVAYPSFYEAASLAAKDGGITSCAYTFTEFVHRIGPEHFAIDELNRWGIANSLHVMSMAHGLIGLPFKWTTHRQGGISWHPSGAVFVGAGISDRKIPFSYHADWGSKGRWSVEINTHAAAYRLCPLENLFRKTSPTEDWQPVPLSAAFADVKAGFVEEVATMLQDSGSRRVRLLSLIDAAKLTEYAEDVFGYAE